MSTSRFRFAIQCFADNNYILNDFDLIVNYLLSLCDTVFADNNDILDDFDLIVKWDFACELNQNSV